MQNFEKEETQRTEFRQILFDLAQSQDLLERPEVRSSFYRRFDELYYHPIKDQQFRHFYSDVFAVLTQIQQDSNLGSIDILGQNLAEIRKKYSARNKGPAGEPIDVSDNIRKLYDHVSLDIARIRYSDAGDEKLLQEEKIRQLQSSVNDLSKKVAKADSLKKKLEDSQKEYIAILGIFSSVVLTFVAGIAFSTSVLENIHRASIYRIVLGCLLIGLVLVNVLYAMFRYVEGIIRPKERSVKPLMISNAIMLLLMLITVVAWAISIDQLPEYIAQWMPWLAT